MYETSFLYIQKKMFSEIIAARENSRKLVWIGNVLNFAMKIYSFKIQLCNVPDRF